MIRRTLDGQVAIVTGAGTGIGHGIALALAEERVKVIICGRRAKPIQDALQEIQERGGEGIAIQADVSQEYEARMARAVQRTGFRIPAVAAARLSEGIDEEEASLLALARQVRR